MKNIEEYIGDISKYRKILKETEQDSIWHAEGNVLNHTEMVLKELKKIPEYKELNKPQKRIIELAAFFHDIGKPFTTKLENGRVRSPNHSKVGSKYFRKEFFDYIHFLEREEIANLINFHGFPIHYYKKEEYKIVEMAEILDTKLVYILAKADILGRISEGKEEFLLNIEYFKEQAIKYDCFGKKRKWKSWRHREFFLKKGYDYIPYEEKVSQVTMLSGLPGVGKDYFLKNYQGTVISLDNIRRELKEEIKREKDKLYN